MYNINSVKDDSTVIYLEAIVVVLRGPIKLYEPHHICVVLGTGLSVFPLSAILLLDFGTVPKVWFSFLVCYIYNMMYIDNYVQD
jgi:hypothetical protein